LSDSPLLLALETATSALSVALLRGGDLLDEESAAPGPAAETLLPAIDSLLSRAGVTVTDLEAFAVSIGPGSFTSLRVGIATAKGLAFGRNCRVAPVSTLAALARAADPGGAMVVPMLDARRGEVYAAAYSGDLNAGDLIAGDPSPQLILEAGVYLPEELCPRLKSPCVLVGEGAALVGEAIRAQLGEGARLLLPPAGVPQARWVGALGAAQLARGDSVPAAALTPHYLRRAEAEVKRTGERFEPAPGSSGPGGGL
jgi:tRNA threonylcarbamoyladenosine biosynthesis protein TsaB